MIDGQCKPAVVFFLVIASGFAGLFLARAQNDSIVAQYHCDEGSGLLSQDSGPYKNQLVLNNTSWTSGIKGSALVFNGSNGWGSVIEPADSSLDFGAGDFSIGAWFKTSANSSGSDIYKQLIVCKGDPYNSGYSMGVYNQRPVAFIGTSGREAGINPSADTVNDDKWHYMVCVRKAGVVYLYVDAVLVHSYASADNVTVGTALTIGKHGEKSEGYYNGVADEITLYKRALTLSEITENISTMNGLVFPLLIPVSSPTYNRLTALIWHPVKSAASYTIEIDTTRKFNAPLVHVPVADTFFTPLAPLPLDTIFWRVACDSADLSYAPQGFFVVKDSNETDLIPYIPDTTFERRPLLTWHRVKNASFYSVLIDSENTFTSLLVSIPVTDTFYSPLVNLPPGPVYWKVKSNISYAYSAVDHFTILSDSIPVLYSFNGIGVTVLRPVFKWHPVHGALSYTFQMDSVSGFTSPYIVQQTADTVFVPSINLRNGEKYYWRVSSDRNQSLFSLTDSLIIQVTGIAGARGGELNAEFRVSGYDDRSLRISVPGQSRRVKISVYSLSGKCVATQENPNAGVVQMMFGEKLQQGMYVVNAATDDGRSYSTAVFMQAK